MEIQILYFTKLLPYEFFLLPAEVNFVLQVVTNGSFTVQSMF